jgi:hypothetical protein
LAFGRNDAFQLGNYTNDINSQRVPAQITVMNEDLINRTIDRFFFSTAKTLSFVVKGIEILTQWLADLTCFNESFSSLSVCSGNGTCSGVDICSCFSGYFGTKCLEFTCNGILPLNPNVCSSYGTCIKGNKCSCDSFHSGNNCEFTSCFGKNSTDPGVCSGRGPCNRYNNCSCTIDYTGKECEHPVCFGKNISNPNICNGRGSCSSPNNCTCNQGYTGPECELSICYGKNSTDSLVCSGQGICQSPNNCNCSLGYQNPNCEQRIILWDLISAHCGVGCKLNKTFWENCLLVKGPTCYCNYSSLNVQINCSSIDVTHM